MGLSLRISVCPFLSKYSNAFVVVESKSPTIISGVTPFSYRKSIPLSAAMIASIPSVFISFKPNSLSIFPPHTIKYRILSTLSLITYPHLLKPRKHFRFNLHLLHHDIQKTLYIFFYISAKHRTSRNNDIGSCRKQCLHVLKINTTVHLYISLVCGFLKKRL